MSASGIIGRFIASADRPDRPSAGLVGDLDINMPALYAEALAQRLRARSLVRIGDLVACLESKADRSIAISMANRTAASERAHVTLFGLGPPHYGETAAQFHRTGISRATAKVPSVVNLGREGRSWPSRL